MVRKYRRLRPRFKKVRSTFNINKPKPIRGIKRRMKNIDIEESKAPAQFTELTSSNNIKFTCEVYQSNKIESIGNKNQLAFIDDLILSKKFIYGKKSQLTIKKIQIDNIIKILKSTNYFDDDKIILNIFEDEIVAISNLFLANIISKQYKGYTNIEILVYSDTKENSSKFNNDLLNLFSDIKLDITSCNITWYYSEGNRTANTEINENFTDTIYSSAYPYILPDIDQYVNDFLTSNERLLIMMGPPGTGKTRFIRHILKQASIYYLKEFNQNLDVYYTSDDTVLSSDLMFVDFITYNDVQFLVLEDIDISLTKRSKGNTSMYKLLSSSDGLIQNIDKKIVISTNLPNKDEVDDALLRPGRCFDIIYFRNLEKEEGNNLLKDLNCNVTVDKSHTLAELYKMTNIKTTGRIVNTNKLKRNTGFV